MKTMGEPQPMPQILSPCPSGRRRRRRRSRDANSPEFEFWMLGNPSFPQPNLLSADELFSDGFLLPLHLLRLSNEPPPELEHEASAGKDQVPETEPNPAVELPATSATSTVSKRWRHLFKKNDKKRSESTVSAAADDRSTKEKDVGVKEKRREKKNGGALGVGASNMTSAAQLNINLWPFSRSRSAGNGGARPRPLASTRKASSAPCSRSNSTGHESKSRKWPHSPTRAAGVHLGRSSPVWQVRRGGGRNSDSLFKNNAEKVAKKDATEGRRKTPVASKARVLSLNVPTCVGYRQHLSCRSDENNSVGVSAAGAGSVAGGQGGASDEGARGSNLFNIRSLFAKKVH